MSEENATAVPEQESIVLASFESRTAAERMLASLGRESERNLVRAWRLLSWSAPTPTVR